LERKESRGSFKTLKFGRKKKLKKARKSKKDMGQGENRLE